MFLRTFTPVDSRADVHAGEARLLEPGLLIAAVSVAAFSQGGARPWSATWTTALLTAATVVALVRRRWTRLSLAAVPVVPVALLAAWAFARGLLAGDPTAGVRYALTLLGVLVVVLLVVHLRRDEQTWFLRVLLTVGIAVSATGWLGVVLRLSPWGHLDSGIWRAATPITYENAAAGLLVPLALVALGYCARAGSTGERRAYSVASVALLVGAGATLSRGGVLALLVGLVVLVALLGRAFALLLPAVVGSGLALVALLPSMPAERPSAPALAVVGLAAGLAMAAAPPRIATGIGLAGAVVVGFVAALNAGRWLPLTGSRLSPVSVERMEQLRAALLLWGEQPLLGVGPGQAALQWTRPDGVALAARYVHNEYVQVLVEFGVVGFTLIVFVALGFLRRLKNNAPSWRRSGAAGAVAGLCAFAVHSSTDFLWHVPVVPLSAAALLALAMERKEQE